MFKLIKKKLQKFMYKHFLDPVRPWHDKYLDVSHSPSISKQPLPPDFLFSLKKIVKIFIFFYNSHADWCRKKGLLLHWGFGSDVSKYWVELHEHILAPTVPKHARPTDLSHSPAMSEQLTIWFLIGSYWLVIMGLFFCF